MQYRQVGTTGEKASVLGFGCMRLPVIDGDETRIDEGAASRLLHRALERGVNYVDTAWAYHGGWSEPWLGRALAGGRRDEVLLATKLPVWELKEPADCERILSAQLERLRTDRIDFYLLHALSRRNWPQVEQAEALAFIDRELARGTIRYAGFSFHDDLAFFSEVLAAREWSFCQIQLNYMDEHYQAGVKGMRRAAGKGLGVIVMEPLRGGKLARSLPADVRAIFDESGHDRSPAEWALRWVWDHPEVNLALSGMGSPAELEENADLAETVTAGSLSPEEKDVIARVRTALHDRMPVPCTLCGYCRPCPEGVNIPRILELYNDAELYGNTADQARVYARFVSADERADRCVACGTCVELCPQGIDIPAELERAHALFDAAVEKEEGTEN